MRSKNLTFKALTLIVICLFLSVSVSAEDDGLGQTLMEIGEGAANGYFSPAVTWFGTGMNSGWYNSSKSYSMFLLPVGISVATINVPFVNITEDMQTFDFSGKIPIAPIMNPYLNGITWDELIDNNINPILTNMGKDTISIKELSFLAKDVPTAFGSKDPKYVKIDTLFNDFREDNALAYDLLFHGDSVPGALNYTAPLQNMGQDSVPLPFVGLDYNGIMPSIPSATMLTVGLKKIPVLNNLQLGFRLIPEYEIPEFGKFGQLGLKIQHEITPHIPVLGSLPFVHVSAFWAMNNLDMEMGPAKLGQHNNIAMLNVSLDAKFLLGLGLYGGIGFENSSLDLELDMSELGMEDYEISIEGDNSFRSTIGVRFSFMVFDIFVDANFGSVTSYNAGITLIGLNGL